MFSSWIWDFIYSAVQGPHWFIFSISKYLYLVLRCFFYYGNRLFYCWNIYKMWVPVILYVDWTHCPAAWPNFGDAVGHFTLEYFGIQTSWWLSQSTPIPVAGKQDKIIILPPSYWPVGMCLCCYAHHTRYCALWPHIPKCHSAIFSPGNHSKQLIPVQSFFQLYCHKQ